MNISFYLKTPNERASVVRISITHNGKVYRSGIGLSVKTSQWRRTKYGQWATNPEASDRMREVKAFFESRLGELSTSADIIKAIDKFRKASSRYGPSAPDTMRTQPSFWTYFDDWAERNCATKNQRKCTKNLIAEIMGRGDDWEDINSAWYIRLNDRLNERGYSVNYKGIISSRLKNVMHEGFVRKYHNNPEYLTFHRHSEQPDTIYLTQEEVDAIWNLNLANRPNLDKARDLFILSVYTCTRYSDAVRITKSMIDRNGILKFVQHKTSQGVTLPVSPRALAILNKHGGAAPKVNQQVYNRDIKRVAELAGITEPTEISYSEGTAHKTKVVPRFQLVVSHTGRRTGITLLYLNGVPLNNVRLISGHSTESQVMKYLRITKEENAKALIDNPFFK